MASTMPMKSILISCNLMESRWKISYPTIVVIFTVIMSLPLQVRALKLNTNLCMRFHAIDDAQTPVLSIVNYFGSMKMCSNIIKIRGGSGIDEDNENDALDALVDLLIEDISSSENDIESKVEDIEETNDDVQSLSHNMSSEVSLRKLQKETANSVGRQKQTQKVENDEKKQETQETYNEVVKENSEINTASLEIKEQSKNNHDLDLNTKRIPKKRSKSRRKKSVPSSILTKSGTNTRKKITELQKSPQLSKQNSLNAQSIPSSSAPAPPPPPPPPNTLYRFLLTKKGMGGHTLVMISVTTYEFLDKYFPPILHLIQWILMKLRLYDPNSSSSKRFNSKSEKRINTKNSANNNVDVNAQYGAFVDLSKGTRKSRVAQRKQTDILAYDKLKQISRNIGSMDQVKLRHCSISFMKRHRLGAFQALDHDHDDGMRNSSTEISRDSSSLHNNSFETYDEYSTKSKRKSRSAKTKMKNKDDEESDNEWIINAFDFGDANIDVKNRLSSDLSSILQNPNKGMKKSSISFLMNSNDRNNDSDKYGDAVDNIDESAGGSSGGNYFMQSLQKTISSSGTRILGAYPNDAVSVEEAGSANGVIPLARRYGYGDWNDYDDTLDDGSDSNFDDKSDFYDQTENNFDQYDNYDKWTQNKKFDSAYNEFKKKKQTNDFFQFDVSFSSQSKTEVPRSQRFNSSSPRRRKSKSQQRNMTRDKNDSFNPISLMSETSLSNKLEDVGDSSKKTKTKLRRRKVEKLSLKTGGISSSNNLGKSLNASTAMGVNKDESKSNSMKIKTPIGMSWDMQMKRQRSSSIGNMSSSKNALYPTKEGSKNKIKTEKSTVFRPRPAIPMQRTSEITKKIEKKEKKN